MRTLLFAGILYLIGVIAILLFRPAIMFNEKGEWKEFGTISQDHTIFPFWMFCIVWAVISYLSCLILIGEYRLKASAVGVVSGLGASLYESEPPEDLVPVLPSKTRSKKKNIDTTMKPGYYMLDAKEMKQNGVPKYLYVGGKGLPPVPIGGGDSDSDSDSGN
jgi:hypothetical protein